MQNTIGNLSSGAAEMLGFQWFIWGRFRSDFLLTAWALVETEGVNDLLSFWA